MSTNSQSICIVGAGPAGLVCALALAQKGILPRIFDQSAKHGTRSRATGLKPETMALLDKLGVGNTIRAMATPIYGSYQSYAGKPLRYIPFADKSAPHCDNLSLNQSDTEAVLIEALEKTAGLKVEWGRAVKLGVGKLQVQGFAPVSPCVIIAADGRFSTIRAAAGITTDKTQDDEISFGCDATVTTPNALDHTAMHQMFGPEGRVVFVPLPAKNRYKISGTFSKTVAHYEVPDAAAMQNLVHGRTGLCIDNVDDVFLYRLGSVRAKRLYKGPVVLAGDSAQTFYPNGGFGLNTAMQQAADLAHTLASRQPLQAYEARWQTAVDAMFAEMTRLRMAAPK
ncbi:MAG: FAD-dependent monooxygenase [Alphaproteobacteria bacterium]|nr:FAD-dependent monooxygenase [Alphaproteobacteria bacterium]